MEFWEFLIQKEGDRSWLPLESLDVEVLEGRYRMVARSSHVDALVDIRISHTLLTEDPPRRRSQARSARTNTDGLIVIFPYTWLQPGMWEVRCFGTEVNPAQATGAIATKVEWQKVVQLQVLPQESEVSDDWTPDMSDDGDEMWLTTGSSQESTPFHLNTGGGSQITTSQDLDFAENSGAASAEFADDSGVEGTGSLPVEPLQAEPLQAEPLQAEPLQAEPLQDEPLPVEPLQAEPLQDEPLQDEQWRAIASVVNQGEAEQTASAPNATPTTPVEVAADSLVAEAPASEGLASEGLAAENPESQVFAAESPEALNADLADPSLAVADLPFSAETLRRQAEAESDAVMDALLEGWVDEADEATAATAASQSESTPDKPLIDPDALQLVLAQTSLTAQPGSALVLNGVVEPVGDQVPPHLPPVALQIVLRDPQTGVVVLETRRSLTSRLLPCPFACQVTLPNPLQTRLLLGEISLVTLDTPNQAGSCLLASQNFSVTASLNDLLEAIANNFPAHLHPPIGDDTLPVEPDLTFLQVPLSTTNPAASPRSRDTQILPPQLYQPDPNRPRSKGIELPMMSPAVEAPVAPEPAEEAAPDATIAADSAVALESETTSSSTVSSPTVSSPTASSQTVETEVPIPEGEQPPAPSHPMEEADEVWQQMVQDPEVGDRPLYAPGYSSENRSPSAEELAFQSLDLENRFLTRLNSLAGDTELSQFLANRPLALQDSELADQEIVVDDASTPPPRRGSLFGQPLRRAEIPPEAPADALAEEEPLPTPELRITATELVAGQRVDVTVILPPVATRLGVKLWMQDLQNRTLLEGPRWLMNFLPNGRGRLEAWTSLTVPHGCLEVQFEAIAVEITTQRESHKASLDRPVVPPDLPSLSLDELEL